MSPNSKATGTSGGLTAATVDVLSRQWRALGWGAAGHSVTRQVDPEALCLASLALEAKEPRLWAVMTDWAGEIGRFLSVQRVTNLVEHFPHIRPRIPRLAAAILQAAKDARWRSLLKGEAPSKPIALAKKHQSRGPAFADPPAFVLRLRSAFTVGIKADLLAFLLGQQDRVSVSSAASALAYTTPAVSRAMRDFVAAGLVQSVSLPAAAEYWIERKDWVGVLGGTQPPLWGFWQEAFAYICAVIHWEEELPWKQADESLRGAALRELTNSHSADLTRAGLVGHGLQLPRSTDLSEWQRFHVALAKRIVDRS